MELRFTVLKEEELERDYMENITVSKIPSALYFPRGVNCSLPDGLKRIFRQNQSSS